MSDHPYALTDALSAPAAAAGGAGGWSLTAVRAMAIRANDGTLGTVDDILWDRGWLLRYLVADIGGWLTGRRILIDADRLLWPDTARGEFTVGLSCQDIRTSPSLDRLTPPTPGEAAIMAADFGWTPYWEGWAGIVPADRATSDAAAGDPKDNGELFGGKELLGLPLVAVDGELGRLEDIQVGRDGRHVTRLIADTRTWLAGAHLILTPPDIARIDRIGGRILTAVSRQDVQTDDRFHRPPQ